MFDGDIVYTLRNLAMFLYPLYAVFFYKYYRWHKAWVAIPLAIFLVWHIPYPNYYNKIFILDSIVQQYKERRHNVGTNTRFSTLLNNVSISRIINDM